MYNRPLDELVVFETGGTTLSAAAPVRYAVRQVLDQEYQKNIIVRENAARQARFKAGNPDGDDSVVSISSRDAVAKPEVLSEQLAVGAKRDFFGRVVLQEVDGNAGAERGDDNKEKKEEQGKSGGGGGKGKGENNVWVSFHEGFSNAVRKPITIMELLRGL